MSKSTKSLRDYQQEWDQQGLCIHCGSRPQRPISKICQHCHVKKVRSNNTLRERREARGLCNHCGKRKPTKGFKRCSICRGKLNILVKKSQAKNRAQGRCSCGRPRDSEKKTCSTCLNRMAKWYRELRERVFAAYGGAKCDCCGEEHFEFLELDHINNDGAQHRREVGNGIKVYQWAEKNGFPPGFRVLCTNCNHSLGFYGYCPHQRTRKSQDESKNSARAC